MREEGLVEVAPRCVGAWKVWNTRWIKKLAECEELLTKSKEVTIFSVQFGEVNY